MSILVSIVFFSGLDVALPAARQVDHIINQNICLWLNWPLLPVSNNAVLQLRLPLTKGGWGLHSKMLQAFPAALGAFLVFENGFALVRTF